MNFIAKRINKKEKDNDKTTAIKKSNKLNLILTVNNMQQYDINKSIFIMIYK